MNEDLRLELLEFLDLMFENHFLSASEVRWLNSLIVKLQEEV